MLWVNQAEIICLVQQRDTMTQNMFREVRPQTSSPVLLTTCYSVPQSNSFKADTHITVHLLKLLPHDLWQHCMSRKSQCFNSSSSSYLFVLKVHRKIHQTVQIMWILSTDDAGILFQQISYLTLPNQQSTMPRLCLMTAWRCLLLYNISTQYTISVQYTMTLLMWWYNVYNNSTQWRCSCDYTHSTQWRCSCDYTHSTQYQYSTQWRCSCDYTHSTQYHYSTQWPCSCDYTE